jgi:hypothetical protein
MNKILGTNREREGGRVNSSRKFFNSYFVKTVAILFCVGFLFSGLTPKVSARCVSDSIIITISAATNVDATTATINGNITESGGCLVTVTTYWGTTDGGQTPANWTNSSAPTSPDQPQGVAAFYTNITGLNESTTYYFSASAFSNPTTKWPAASLNFTTTADVTNPTISTLSPADNATGVTTTANLVITFSEAVDAKAGADNDIVIKKASDNSTIETIDAQDAKVSGSGTNTITINPAATLDEQTGYYVLIGADAFDDASGNSFAGISDTTTWNFTTGDFTNPTISTLSPADNATGVTTTANLVITLSVILFLGYLSKRAGMP